jgi:hypothetical protein
MPDLDDGADMLSRNYGNYNPRSETSQKRDDLNIWWGSLKETQVNG